MNEELLQFHIDNEYYILAEEVEKDFIAVDFPINIIDDLDEQISRIVYEINDNEIIKTNLDTKESGRVEVPTYARRILTFHDFILTCQTINISNNLLVCYSPNKNDVKGNIMNLISKPKNSDDKKLEKKFLTFYTKVLQGQQVDVAEFKDAYLLLFELNQSGGIL